MTLEELHTNQSASAHMGNEGELFVMEYEQRRLPAYLHSDIIRHADCDVAMGYDIISFNAADSVKADRYIEVKTYRGHKHFRTFSSSNLPERPSSPPASNSSTTTTPIHTHRITSCTPSLVDSRAFMSTFSSSSARRSPRSTTPG